MKTWCTQQTSISIVLDSRPSCCLPLWSEKWLHWEPFPCQHANTLIHICTFTSYMTIGHNVNIRAYIFLCHAMNYNNISSRNYKLMFVVNSDTFETELATQREKFSLSVCSSIASCASLACNQAVVNNIWCVVYDVCQWKRTTFHGYSHVSVWGCERDGPHQPSPHICRMWSHKHLGGVAYRLSPYVRGCGRGGAFFYVHTCIFMWWDNIYFIYYRLLETDYHKSGIFLCNGWYENVDIILVMGH